MATTSSHQLNTVRSADGTSIAFERLGAGDPVVVIGGATCDRARTRPPADVLARHVTVLTYDRRGLARAGSARSNARLRLRGDGRHQQGRLRSKPSGGPGDSAHARTRRRRRLRVHDRRRPPARGRDAERRLRQLEGEGHVVDPEVLAPVLAEFLAQT